jgi:hypothetical protein
MGTECNSPKNNEVLLGVLKSMGAGSFAGLGVLGLGLRGI